MLVVVVEDDNNDERLVMTVLRILNIAQLPHCLPVWVHYSSNMQLSSTL